MTDLDEQSLIDQARADPEYFLQLYERYVDRIYAFIYRRTADEALTKDVTSATFEKALRNLKHYQSRGISFSAWLYRIARNELTDHYRQRLPLLSLLSLFNRHTANRDVEQTVQANQEHNELHTALSRLPHADRELITLRYFDGLTSSEVAEILSCSVNNVYLRLHRALGRLRKQLEKFEYTEVVYVRD